MAVRTREEIMEAIQSRLGDDHSDEALALVEDMSDTLSDYENRVNNDTTDWKKKYEDNDKEWRAKYRERFFSGGKHDEDDEPAEPPKKLTFDELFKED